jgi:uncharacterized protein (UPF0276 family)
VLFHRRNGDGPRGGRSAVPEDALGVGVLYNPSLPAWLQDHLDLVDYVEVIPDMFWTDRGPGARPRFVELPSWMAVLDWLAVRRPLVVHATGLSLGSAGADDPEYRNHLAAWSERYAARWLSDHLSFTQVRDGQGRTQRAALALPVARDAESLEVVAARVRAAQEALAVPFLVENHAAYVDLAEPEMTEAGFLNALVARTGCGLLLDLHNLHLSSRRRAQDAFLDEVDLGSVMEIHVAAGSARGGLDLLESVAPRAPRLRGVTLEIHDSDSAALGQGGLGAELDRARARWPRARGG